MVEIRALTDDVDGFDPATAHRVFRVCSSTFCSDALGVPILKHFEKAAPYVSVQFDDLLGDTFARLVRGQIDAIITIEQRLVRESVYLDGPLSALTLFSDQLVLAVASDNSAIGETISFGELCELPYIETRIANEAETLGE